MSKKKVAFEDMQTAEKLSALCTFLRDVIKDYQYHKNEQLTLEDASQDLLHQLEFGSYEDRRTTATALSKIRKQRRVHKNQTEILQYLYNYLKTINTKLLFDLEAVLGDTRKAQKRVESENKFYNARVIKDLPICRNNNQTEGNNN